MKYSQIITVLFLLTSSFIPLKAQSTLKINNGSHVKVNNLSVVLVDVNVENNGTITSNNGKVALTGGSTTTLSGSGSTLFDSLSVNKSSGEVQLAQDIMVGGDLELLNTHLDLQTSNLKMLDPSSISGASASGYVQTSSTGTLARPVADGDVTFPVGNSSYNPAILNNNGGSADFYTMRVRDELLEGGTSGAQVDEYGVNRTWEIGEETGGGSNLDVTLTWSAAEEIGTTGSDFVQANYNSGMWNTVASGAAGSTFGLKSLGSTDNANLGDYAIFEDRSPLTDSYICNDNGALMVNGTLMRTENYHAGTTLTSDAVITPSGSILYTAGTEVQLQKDFHAQNGSYFHAFIATCNFSSLNEVEQRTEEELEERYTTELQRLEVEVFPNPFNRETNIKFFLPESDGVQLIISDLNGRILKVKESDAQEGWQQTNFDAGNLPSGNYMLIVRSNGQQVVKQLVVQE